MIVPLCLAVLVFAGIAFHERRVSAQLEVELECAYRARDAARREHLEERQKLIAVLFPDTDLQS